MESRKFFFLKGDGPLIKLDKREDLVGARDQVARDDVPVPFLAFLKPRILRKHRVKKMVFFYNYML